MSDNPTKQFEAHRPLMFSIAYRMLGSATEAEDIVQEAYLRYQRAATADIVSHKAFLSTIVTRLSIDHLAAAQKRRSEYIGPWLPEPVSTEDETLFSPTQQIELHESLSVAFLTLLEYLTPLERAVFLLREVFDYEYAEIAGIIGTTEVASRQMFSRARKHIAGNRPRFTPDPTTHRELLTRFISAVRTGDLEGLLHMLSEDAVLWADGGGKARGAALHELRGRQEIARFVQGSVRFWTENLRTEIAEVNGEPAVVLRTDEEVIVVLLVTTYGEQISEIRAIGNPDKLHWIE